MIGPLYLDANAHVSLQPRALQAYQKFLHSSGAHGHPSSLAQPGREAALALEQAREKIAQLIGAQSSSQIIFTNSCTQACEWGLNIFFQIKQKFKDDYTNICTSPLEHPAVKDVVEQANHRVWQVGGNRISVLNCSSEVELSLNNSDINKIICVHMQNELGTIQSLTWPNCYVFSDMSQSLGKIPINVTELGVDVAAFGGHKFGGPGGVGFMYLKDTDYWTPFATGSRYYLDRPGTPDVAGVVATAAALEEALETLPARTEKMAQFQKALEEKLLDMGLQVLGTKQTRSPNTTYLAGLNKARATLIELEQFNIFVGLGSACGSYTSNISPLMRSLGYNYTLDNVMRLSQWGEYGAKEAQYVADKIWSLDQQ